MTPRESVEAVLRGGVADRIPLTMYDKRIPQCAAERFLRNNGLCLVQQRLAPAYRTQHPNVRITSHTCVENGKELIRTNYETPQGTLHTITEDADITTWTHKMLFTKPEDYKPLLFIINDMQFQPNYEQMAYAQKVDGGDSIFRGLVGAEPMQALISHYMGPETFSMEWFDNRDEILKLYDALVEKRRKVYPILADSPVLAFNYGGNVSPEIMGLDRFEKYYVPHYNEAAEILHKKGKLVGCHFDANCKLLADAIANTDLDYIEAFTPAPDTDMTLAEARRAWPDKTLWINFPSSVHLEPIEKIKEVTVDLLKQAGSPERFIMGITEAIPQDRWRENMLAISKTLIDCESWFLKTTH